MTSQNKDTHLSGGDSEMWAGQLVHRERENQDDAVSIAYIRSDYLVKLDDFSLIKPNEGQGYQIGVGNNFPWVHVLPRFKYIMINTVSLFIASFFFSCIISNIHSRALIGIPI